MDRVVHRRVIRVSRGEQEGTVGAFKHMPVRIAAIVAAGAVAVWIALPIVIPQVVDTNTLIREIEKGISDSFGIRFGIDSLRIEPTLFDGLHVVLDANSLRDLQGRSLGDIKTTEIKIRYLPLITEQKAIIKRIRLNHVTLPVGEQSLFNQIKLKYEDKPSKAELKDATIIINDYVINDARVADHNSLILDKARRFVVKGKSLRLDHLMADGKAVKLQMQGQMFFLPRKETDVWTRYNLMLEIPEQVFKRKPARLDMTDIERLRLALNGREIGLDLRLNRGKGSLETKATSLMRAEALYHQMNDTFDIDVPEIVHESYLSGKASGRLAFDLNTPKDKPPLLRGQIRLADLALSDRKSFRNPVLNRVNGVIELKDYTLAFHDFTFGLDRHRFRVRGWLNPDTQKLDMLLQGNNIRLAALKDSINRLGQMRDIKMPDLRQYQADGLANINLRFYGNLAQPLYRGRVAVANAYYRDPASGLRLNRIAGILDIDRLIHLKNVRGFAESTPFRLAGTVSRTFNAYNLELTSNNVNLERFFNEVVRKIPQARQQLAGIGTPKGVGDVHLFLVQRPGAKMPDYHGTIALKQGSYQDPQTGLLVSNINGLVDIGREIVLQGFRGELAGSLFRVSGNIDKAFRDYRLQVASNNVNMHRLFNDVLARIPQLRDDIAMFRDTRGTGDVNLTLSKAGGINGNITLNQLAIRPEGSAAPVEFARLSLRLAGNSIILPSTHGRIGDFGFLVSGTANRNGQYRFGLNANDAPVSALRDSQALLNGLVGMETPAIWNTAGTMSANAVISNKLSEGVLDFHNAGLSWEGGDFPLYDLNGRLRFRAPSGGLPTVQSEGLSFRYGNSPVSTSVAYNQVINLQSNGVLSPLVVNHYLASPRAVTLPYRELPFAFGVNGQLLSLVPGGVSESGKPNNLNAEIQVDLSRLFVPQEPEEVAEEVDINQPAPASQGQREVRLSDKLLGKKEEEAETAEATDQKSEPTDSANQGEEAEPTESTLAQAPDETRALEHPAQSPRNGNATLGARVSLLRDSLTLEELILGLGESGQLVGEGQVDNIFSMGEERYNFHVATLPEIDLSQLRSAFDYGVFEHTQGVLATDLQISGDAGTGQALDGWLEINGLKLPDLQVSDLTGVMTFSGQSAVVNIPSLNIPGVSVSLKGQTNELFSTPVDLEDVSIQGARFTVASFNDFNQNIVNDVILKKFLNNILPPRQQGDPALPVQIRGANVALNEVIYQNIILENVTSKLSLYSNGYLELTDAKLQAAGGNVTGYISMNPSDNQFTSIQLNANDVKANALTKALLNVTNQIFGDLSGTIRFTTQGQNDVDMLKNANGTASFTVTDGRLPAIAKVETLLTAVNVVRGGVLGLNLNNILRTLGAYNTNYFAELSGDFQIAESKLYTDDLVSDGEDLDLFIQGSVAMDTGKSDLLVNGLMSQNVSGALGGLGKLSVGSIVRYVPGIGYIPVGRTRRAGILQRIPGLGYTPGFGGVPGESNRFQVRISGDLDDPKAIQSFQWVRSSGL